MGDPFSMSLSGDSFQDETFNRGPWCCSCSDRMNFPFRIIQCNFHFFQRILFTYSLFLTSIFIFCLGVRSPWRINATTQRSSILQKSHCSCTNERNKGNNHPLILHIRRNIETDIKRSLPYGTAPGIECLRAHRDPTKELEVNLSTRPYTNLSTSNFSMSSRRCWNE